MPFPRDVALPALFVVLWSTGFVFARMGLPYTAPFTFLAVRLAVASALMLAIAVLTRAMWPRDARAGGHVAVAGLLLNGCYLIGVFEAVDLGVAAGVVALIAGLQPILTAAVVGPLLGERVTARQWAGFLLGFAGVAVVVIERLGIGAGTVEGFALTFLCLFGITGGTLYQKRFCQDQDPITGSAIQFAVSAAAMTVGALLFENRMIVWSTDFTIAFLWLTLVLSVGTFNLLVYLIRRGEASRVSSLFYLVPPCTALLGWWMFGETLSPLALAGMTAAVAGVALVNRQPR